MRPSPMRATSTSSRVRERAPILPAWTKWAWAPAKSPASKIRSIAEPVFEVALLDAVDAGRLEQPARAIDPAPAAAGGRL